MRYQPTLYLPTELAQKINEVVFPIETTAKTLAMRPNISLRSKQVLTHNLRHFVDFHNQQETIVQDYLQVSRTLMNSTSKIR